MKEHLEVEDHTLDCIKGHAENHMHCVRTETIKSVEELISELYSKWDSYSDDGGFMSQNGQERLELIERWLTDNVRSMLRINTSLVKKETLEVINKKYWLNPKRTKSETAKDNAWNDLGNTLRRGV